jgi:hypothetical protein
VLPSPTPLRTPLRLAVAAVATALFGQLLTGTATAAPATPSTASPGTIAWEPCESPSGEGDFECGTLEVPVDWAGPSPGSPVW